MAAVVQPPEENKMRTYFPKSKEYKNGHIAFIWKQNGTRINQQTWIMTTAVAATTVGLLYSAH